MASKDIIKSFGIGAALALGSSYAPANSVGERSNLSHSAMAAETLQVEIAPQVDLDYERGPDIVIDEGEIVSAEGSDRHDTILVKLHNDKLLVVDRREPDKRKVIVNFKGASETFDNPRLSLDGSHVLVQQRTVTPDGFLLDGTALINTTTGVKRLLEAENPYAASHSFPLKDGKVAVVEVEQRGTSVDTLGDTTVAIYDQDAAITARHFFPFEQTSSPSGIYRQTIHEVGGYIYFMRAGCSYLLDPKTLDIIKRSEFGHDNLGVPSSGYFGGRPSVVDRLGLIVNLDTLPARNIHFDFSHGDEVAVYDILSMATNDDPQQVGRGFFDRFYGAMSGWYRPLAVDVKTGVAYFAGTVVENPEDRGPGIKWGMGVLKVSNGGQLVETMNVPDKGDGVSGSTSHGDGGVIIIDPHLLTTIRVETGPEKIFLPRATVQR